MSSSTKNRSKESDKKKLSQSSLKLTNNKRAPNKKQEHNNTLSRGAVPPSRQDGRAIRLGETGQVIGRKSHLCREEKRVTSDQTSEDPREWGKGEE